MNDPVAAAAAIRSAAAADGNLCRPFAVAMNIPGVGISTLGGLLPTQPIGATNETSARLEDLQLQLGEGPCWDAVSTGLPVSAPDFRENEHRWPGFRSAALEEPVAAVFAFPLQIGPLSVGAVDFYATSPGELGAERERTAGMLADAAARELLRRELRRLVEPEQDSDDDRRYRAVVHQATGMVLAQLDIGPEDALLVLRGRAFASGRTLDEIARDVVERRLDFSQLEGDDHG